MLPQSEHKNLVSIVSLLCMYRRLHRDFVLLALPNEEHRLRANSGEERSTAGCVVLLLTGSFSVNHDKHSSNLNQRHVIPISFQVIFQKIS